MSSSGNSRQKRVTKWVIGKNIKHMDGLSMRFVMEQAMGIEPS